tara:strand:- start:195 stop:542 length:348 start_codon:yes stop_codon:yes gene_type:complete
LQIKAVLLVVLEEVALLMALNLQAQELQIKVTVVVQQQEQAEETLLVAAAEVLEVLAVMLQMECKETEVSEERYLYQEHQLLMLVAAAVLEGIILLEELVVQEVAVQVPVRMLLV